MGCLTYLGRRLRMNGAGRDAQALNEQLLCEIYDVRNAIIELSYPFKEVCRDEAEHKAKSEKALDGEPFKKFEALLEKTGTDYFCGKAPCVCVFHKTPKCKEFYDRFKALPSLQKYFESAAYKFPVNNPIASAYFQ